MKTYILLGSLLIATPSFGSELIFSFNSPAFSGNGWSTHVLTIEQLEQQKKDKIEAEEQAALDKAERDFRNTNSYKFQNNLESRIYAQLSRQIADNMFGEGEPVVFDSEDDWVESTSPFGDLIKWQRWENKINVEIYDSNGSLISSFSAPIGEFAF